MLFNAISKLKDLINKKKLKIIFIVCIVKYTINKKLILK